MDASQRENHWQHIYQNKSDEEVSWTQEYPNIAIEYLEGLNLPKSAGLIDIGGGASKFPDAALEHGFSNISVLDISKAALDRSKSRLGSQSKSIDWIVSDIHNFNPKRTYDFWYDRAVFHFLNKPSDILKYIELVYHTLNHRGHFLVGTFSENGPLKCSGLEVCRYSEEDLKKTFGTKFEFHSSFKESHITPFGSEQEFQFCGFVKR